MLTPTDNFLSVPSPFPGEISLIENKTLSSWRHFSSHCLCPESILYSWLNVVLSQDTENQALFPSQPKNIQVIVFFTITLKNRDTAVQTHLKSSCDKETPLFGLTLLGLVSNGSWKKLRKT